MQNLTNKQQNIILQITNEFTRINEQKALPLNSNLFDIDSLLSQRDSDIEDRSQIEFDNLYYDELLSSIIEQDIEKINLSLVSIGLCCFTPSHWHQTGKTFVIDTLYQKSKGTYGDNKIAFEYKLITKEIRFNSRLSPIDKKSNEYVICSYVSSNTEAKFKSIEEFAKDERIIDKLKNLINN